MGGKGLAFAALDFLVCVTLWMLMQLAPPPTPHSTIRTFGTYAVVLTWPKKCNADLDLYVREPNGAVVYYNRVNGTIAHLEHDDIPANSGYRGQDNFERVVLRGFSPGEYVVNVHVYSLYDCTGRIPSMVELWRLAGRDEETTKRLVVLHRNGEEHTAFRFSLRRDGETFGINHLQRNLIQ